MGIVEVAYKLLAPWCKIRVIDLIGQSLCPDDIGRLLVKP